MAQFSKDNQPKKRRGKSKASLISEGTKKEAARQLSDAVEAGEAWAVKLVLETVMPKLKPVTPRDSLDGEYIELKMKELHEFEERIAALEAKK